MNKAKVKMNKPIHLDLPILELSKKQICITYYHLSYYQFALLPYFGTKVLL